MSDLVKRLRVAAQRIRKQVEHLGMKLPSPSIEEEAAALIEAQDARIKELEAGLKPFAEAAPYFEPEEQEGQVLDDDHMIADVITLGNLRHAASLLEEKK